MTTGGACRIERRSAAVAEEKWFRHFNPNSQGKLSLVCLPYAGSGASVFSGWGRELGKRQPVAVVGVCLPGREGRGRESPCADLQSMVCSLARAMGDCIHPPYAVFGHSLGALVGFELIRELRRLKKPLPVHFFAAGREAPAIRVGRAPMNAMPDGPFIAELCRRYEGIPPELLNEPELLRRFLPTLRADLKLTECYQYYSEPPLACSITALGGSADRSVSVAETEAWRNETSVNFQRVVLEGGHLFLRDSSRQLLDRIAWTLSRSLRNSQLAD